MGIFGYTHWRTWIIIYLRVHAYKEANYRGRDDSDSGSPRQCAKMRTRRFQDCQRHLFELLMIGNGE